MSVESHETVLESSLPENSRILSLVFALLYLSARRLKMTFLHVKRTSRLIKVNISVAVYRIFEQLKVAGSKRINISANIYFEFQAARSAASNV